MSGYIDCGCRDCFGIAIGKPGDMCSDCEDAGCEKDQTCSVEYDLGCDEEDES